MLSPELEPGTGTGPIVDTTGAGDAFYAGLLTGLLQGLSLKDAGRLGADLKWEASRGALFPHLYAPLDLAAVLWVEPLPLGQDGRHLLPEGALA